MNNELKLVSMYQVFKAVEYANDHPDKYLSGTTNWCAAVAFALNRQIIDTQPATAKVVLPERKHLGDPSPLSLVEGWNACLDEVAKLNGGQS